MKIAKNLFRFSTILKGKAPLLKAQQNRFKFGLAGSLTLGTTYWLSTKNVLSEELETFQLPDDIEEGQMKELRVGPKDEDTVLVYKHHGVIYCTQSKCSHFGFSLAKGFLSGDKIICPLHNAGFSIKTGKADQGPVFNGLKTFQTEVKNGKILVRIPKNWAAGPPPFEIDPKKLDNSKKVVIIGAGPAALSAADTLRQCGYTGYIYMITRQKEIPYDRTMLSKMSDAEKKPGPIRSQQYYDRNGIVFVKQANVNGIDYQNKKVKIDNHEALPYDSLLIASGCVNRQPAIKGLDKVNFNSLRTIKDYQAINKAVRESGVKNITIVGAGFIGIQTASAIKSALKDQVNITILEQSQVPLEHVLGRDVGTALKDLAESKGVKIISNAKIQEIKGTNQKPTQVVLSSGSVPTDVLIMATGVRPAVDFAPELVEQQLNGIKTNAFLETDKKGVFAAGDIASYPYWPTGQRARIEHYNEAIYQGSIAALNIIGRRVPIDNIPFFWTRSFDNTLSFTGYTRGWDYVHIVGDLKQRKFVAFYINKKSNKVLGAASMGVMNQIQIINEAMRSGEMATASRVMEKDFKVQELIKDINAANPKCTRCSHLHE